MAATARHAVRRRVGTIALAAVLAGTAAFPVSALAAVRIDDTELVQGDNAVGGGTATYGDAKVDMVGVTAGQMTTDEDLTVNFNGGNSIDNFDVEGSAQVDVHFEGDNAVEDFAAHDQSSVSIDADGHDSIEEVKAFDNSEVTVNVTGENEFEEIIGYDDANITVRGTDCQKKDVVKLGEGERDPNVSTMRGDLTIDHVTVEVEAETAYVGSESGNVTIDTSKIEASDDTKYVLIEAGGTMDVKESVIDVAGTMHSNGKMTIDHSDVTVEAPEAAYDDGYPYRVWSYEGIELIDEENGEVKEGEVEGKRAFYVDTDDGKDVKLEADGDPAYLHCKGEAISPAAKALPRLGDPTNLLAQAALALSGAGLLGLGFRTRHKRDEDIESL